MAFTKESMDFQKEKIINKLEKQGWSLIDVYIPKDNWPYLEVITFKKNKTLVYLTFFKDPTDGYIFKTLRRNKLKHKSKDFDALLYGNDPNLNENAIKISELNLGKGWDTKLSDFMSDCEVYYQTINCNL